MNERDIRDAWVRFVGDGDEPKSVRSAVAGSWERSKGFNVDVSSRAAPVLSEAELYRRRADSALLSASARQAMARAAHILVDASSMLILTDGSGHIIETLGDKRTIEEGREVHLQDGGCWTEDKIGTNAIGTALAAKLPVQIHAAEHFCERVQQWTCAAAPIFHPIDHELLGVIDISGPPKTFSSQSLALAVSIAGHMEGLISQTIKHQHDRLMSCFQEKQRKWASHDLLAIDRRGGIVHASPNALRKFVKHLSESETDDLSYLRSLPFGHWPDDLGKRMVNMRTMLVQDGDDELGAIIVFPTSQRLPPKLLSKRRRIANDDSSQVATSRPVIVSENGRAEPRTDERLDRAPLATRPENAPAALPFVAADPKVKQICKNVASAARLHMPVLICGQTGTGKEMLARHAHTSSGRKGSFVPVNCSALPETLVEAELFGYAEGAFTGARRGGAQGLAREADGGTLFLDEIGDMPFALQSVLLRFLDDFTVRPVGGQPRKVDVLLVSATNVDLGQAVTSRKFRPDLLYRLNTMHVTLPSLAERTDFTEVAMHLLERISPDTRMTEKALAALAAHPWNGNIRELRGMLARLSLAAAENSDLIDDTVTGAFLVTTASTQSSGPHSLRELQREQLLSVYKETGGNISETARRLGVCRNTVYRALDSSSA
jgi:transcriptional regulator of acetoin/glycerol metabolism